MVDLKNEDVLEDGSSEVNVLIADEKKKARLM